MQALERLLNRWMFLLIALGALLVLWVNTLIDLQEARQALAACAQRGSQVEAENGGLRADRDRLQAENQTQRAGLVACQAQTIEQQNQIGTLEGQVKELLPEVQGLRVINDLQKNKLLELQAVNNRQNFKIGQLQEDLTDSKDRITHLEQAEEMVRLVATWLDLQQHKPEVLAGSALGLVLLPAGAWSGWLLTRKRPRRERRKAQHRRV